MAHMTMYSTTACPYCVAVKRLLKQRGAKQIEKILIGHGPGKHEEIMTCTDRHTVPQIYIDKRHTDGFGDLSTLDREDGLAPLLAA